MNSKQKGGSFERKIAKFLSLLLTDGKEDHAVYRTHSSGAIYTINSAVSNKFEGDLYNIIERGIYKKLDAFFDQFVVECKYRTKLSFQPPLNKDFLDIIDDIKSKYSHSDKFSLLVIGANNKQPIYFSIGSLNLDEDIILNVKGRDINLYGYTQDTFKNIINEFYKKEI